MLNQQKANDNNGLPESPRDVILGDAAGRTVEDQCQRLGEILGLTSPVEERVLSAALHNQSYAVNLLLCRETPVFLNQLLAHPPASPVEPPSTHELLRKGAEALWRWGKTGFTKVDDEVLERRLATCQVCPNLSSPPEGREALYGLAGTAAGSKSVCRVCGCPVARKAAMTFENCPDPHPQLEGLSRWGEPTMAKT